MIGWTTGGRVHHTSSARKVTHPSTILALGNLTLEFPWDLGSGLGFQATFEVLRRPPILALFQPPVA